MRLHIWLTILDATIFIIRRQQVNHNITSWVRLNILYPNTIRIGLVLLLENIGPYILRSLLLVLELLVVLESGAILVSKVSILLSLKRLKVHTYLLLLLILDVRLVVVFLE